MTIRVPSVSILRPEYLATDEHSLLSVAGDGLALGKLDLSTALTSQARPNASSVTAPHHRWMIAILCESRD